MTPAEPFPRAELKRLVAILVELPEGCVIWDHEPRPFVGQVSGKPGFWVELSMHSVRPKGVDDQRHEYNVDPGVNRNELLQYGYRIATVKVLVSSFDPDTASFDIMERLRRRLRSLTAKGGLQELNMSLIEFAPSVDLPKPADNRTQSESTMDVKFGWLVTEDPGDDDGVWIEKVAEFTDDLTS